jgi:hypothetical protein
MGPIPLKAEIPCIRGFRERQPDGSATSLSISTRFCGTFQNGAYATFARTPSAQETQDIETRAGRFTRSDAPALFPAPRLLTFTHAGGGDHERDGRIKPPQPKSALAARPTRAGEDHAQDVLRTLALGRARAELFTNALFFARPRRQTAII